MAHLAGQVIRSLGLLVGLASPVVAQAPLRRVTEDFRIEPVDANLTAIGTLLIDPAGNVMVTQPDDHQLLFFGVDGSRASFGRAGQGPGEFNGHAWLAGWRADTIWVSDPLAHRLTFIAPGRKFLRTVIPPSQFTAEGMPTPSNAGFVMAFPVAILPKGAMLMHGLFGGPASRAWSGFGTSRESPLMLVSAESRIERVLVRVPEGRSCSDGAQGQRTIQRPLCVTAALDLSRNGQWIVITDPLESKGTFQVTLVAASGDTTFSRAISYRPIAVTRRWADSVRTARVAKAKTVQPERIPDIQAMVYPTTFPPFRRTIVADDGTIWIERWTPDPTHRWLILARDGSALGEVEFPAAVRLLGVSGDVLWGSLSSEDDELGLVRYRLSPRGR